MDWTQLAVIEPPKVVALDIAVTPPAYTGLATAVGGPRGQGDRRVGAGDPRPRR